MAEIRLYDTLSDEIRAFEPEEGPGGAVRMYVCGITPYDTTHLGHAATYVFSDVLIRILRHLHHEVRYVQNLTDIDDAILRASREREVDWRALGNRWTEYFIQDMKTLNVLPPDHFPRATEHIPQMQDVIARLLDRGSAYQSEGAVYFDTQRWSGFGRLSRLRRDKMLSVANDRGNHPDDPRKRHALDFALWRATEPGEPAWESPWGPGRPGWHIECSTMATCYLGDTIDIHGGGRDLVFPHHEGEIAQSESATDERFCRWWFHIGMLRHQGKKMSKSVGNLVMARDLLEDCTPDALRLYLLAHHYRSSWEHAPEELPGARDRAARWRRALEEPQGGGGTSTLDPEPERDRFLRHLCEDLDTPSALLVADALAERIVEAAAEGVEVSAARMGLREMGRILGLRLGAPGPEAEVTEG